MHNGWLNRRTNPTPEEIKRWKVSDDYIAARAEAVLEIFGPEAVLDELGRWSLRSVPIRAALRLVPALIESGKAESLREILCKKLVAPPWIFDHRAAGVRGGDHRKGLAKRSTETAAQDIRS